MEGKRGRPSKYSPELDAQAFKLGKFGVTDAQLAEFFGVSESTVGQWKLDYPTFSGALKAGKDYADGRVVQSLYRRATGYNHPAVKIFCDAKTGEVTRADYTEHYPPDTTAGIFWLKNRKKGEWRDRHEVEHDASDNLRRLIIGD